MINYHTIKIIDFIHLRLNTISLPMVNIGRYVDSRKVTTKNEDFGEIKR